MQQMRRVVFIETDMPLSEAEIDRFKREFESECRTRNTVILPPGVRIKALDIPINDKIGPLTIVGRKDGSAAP